MRLRDQIRQARKARKLSQKALGELAGTNAAHICRIENGDIEPRPATVQRLATALKTTLTYTAHHEPG